MCVSGECERGREREKIECMYINTSPVDNAISSMLSSNFFHLPQKKQLKHKKVTQHAGHH